MKLLKALQAVVRLTSADTVNTPLVRLAEAGRIAQAAIEAHESCDHKWEAPPHPDELLICAKCDREMWTDDES